ncbi:MAG: HEAT repeat domain-containing protein [Deltaproteobacteria bacterium]|nr:HEAT repeat domain-containing protein [Deltaproteobacteria bacterium]
MPNSRFWEEPLYRLVLQITFAQILFLASVIAGIILIRSLKLYRQKKNKRISQELFTPLMKFLSKESSIDEAFRALKKYPRHNICMELERYALMLKGSALADIRVLYECLNLRKHGKRLNRSFFWWRRLEGVRLLGAAGGEEVSGELLRRLADSHNIVQLAAARSLGSIDDPSAIEPIVRIMAESKQMSRRQLAQTLIAFGPAVQPYLRELVRKEITEPRDSRFIAMILEVLALTGDLESGPEIRAALMSPHLEIRIAAFKSAIILHLPLSPIELKNGLTDEQWPVRAQAALASGKLGDLTIGDELGNCLCDRSWWVRYNAGAALFQLGPLGIEKLEYIAQHAEDAFARDMAIRTLTSDPSYQALADHSDILKRLQPSGQKPGHAEKA